MLPSLARRDAPRQAKTGPDTVLTPSFAGLSGPELRILPSLRYKSRSAGVSGVTGSCIN
jgi:hypothetical protein